VPRHGCLPSLLSSDAQTAIDKGYNLDESDNWPARNAVEIQACIRKSEERYPTAMGGLA
jgi:hypothetical protein